MAVEWAIFLMGGALGFYVRALLDRIACERCSAAIRYREDLVRSKEER